MSLGRQVLHKGVNLINVEDKQLALEAIMNSPGRIVSLVDIMKTYKIAKFSSTEQMLSSVAKKKGLLEKGNKPQLEEAAELVIEDFIAGKIKFYTDIPK